MPVEPNVGAIKTLIKTICTIKLKVNDSGILITVTGLVFCLFNRFDLHKFK